jgi:hypothetical protein
MDQYQIAGRGTVFIVDTRSYDLVFKLGGVFYTESPVRFWKINGIERMGSRPIVGLLVREKY